MPPVTLPLTFSNSFWSQDYRAGLEVLYSKLEQGVAENEEIVAFIKARVRAEKDVGVALASPQPTGTPGRGFGTDDGASLYLAFRGLQHESVAQGQAHLALSRDLQEQVVEPFEAWAFQHADRVQASKQDLVDEWIGRYEVHIQDVQKLRETYVTKSHKADELEEEAKSLPIAGTAGKSAEPDRLTPSGLVKRAPSVTERISERLRSLSSERSPIQHPVMPDPMDTLEAEKEADDGKSDGTVTPKVDKGKGKEIVDSPNSLSPVQGPNPVPNLNVVIPTDPNVPRVAVTTHISLGGISMPAQDLSNILFYAQQEIGIRSVKFTLLGEYEHCFTGEEFVVYLKNHVDGFKGSLDAAEDAARTLTEEHNALRRIGELGNKFENTPNAYYQFRAKAFNLQASLSKASQDSISSSVSSPVEAAATTVQNGLKRSNTVFSSFVKTIQNAAGPTQPDELPHARARREATEADTAYRKGVRQLDQHRCAVEGRIDESLKALQRWELDRLKAVKTVLLQYQGILTSLNGPLTASNDQSSVLVSSFMPESDLRALIERYRTGPFRPEAKIYESITHETDQSFGIDLRKWGGEGAFSPVRSISSMDEITGPGAKNFPPVFTALLQALKDAYRKQPTDDERRKAWIYEVPLQAVHQLRATLNTLPFDMPIQQSLFEKYDAPVVASALKIWFLELNPPVTGWESWDELKKVYPSVGADVEGKDVEEELRTALGKLPMIDLKVLDAFISHLRELIDTTTTEEDNDTYVTKLSLTLARAVIRPKQENSMSIQSNHAHLFVADLLKHYSTILPTVIEKKAKELASRPVPTKKRTTLVDSRAMRRSIDASVDPRKLLEAQFQLRNPNSRPSSPNPGSGGRPAFVSPPSSPPAVKATPIMPSITTAVTSEPSPKRDTPSVSVAPPTPINLNDDTKPITVVPATAAAPQPKPAVQPIPAAAAPAAAAADDEEDDDDDDEEEESSEEESEEESGDEPFTPPVAAAAAAPAPAPAPVPAPAPAPVQAPTPAAASPASPASAANDRVIATGPTSLHRTTSGETSRIRGPRGPLRGGRPPTTTASPSGARPTPNPANRAGSPRNSISSPSQIRGASPTSTRGARSTTPTRGGRIPSGSFSRTRPMGDGTA